MKPEHEKIAIESMCQLNRIGESLGQLDGVTAMTDVTGFGLAGHLIEICEGSKVSAVVEFDRLPVLPHIHEYLELGCSPGGTARNFSSAGERLVMSTDEQFKVVCDPQTSGGLLVTVDASAESPFLKVAAANHLLLEPIGRIIEGGAGPLLTIT